DYARRVSVDVRGDEIGRVASAFNAMAATIGAHNRVLEAEVRDRTAELVQTLEELHRTQDAMVLKERLATLGQLAGGVGHELRNPLGVMTNAVYVLETVF